MNGFQDNSRRGLDSRSGYMPLATMACDEATLDEDEKEGILSGPEGDPQDGRTSVPLTALNIANNMLGGGIIAFSYAMKETGFPCGVIMTILVGIITTFTLNLLAEAAALSNQNTYQKVCGAAFGRVGSFVIGALQVVTCLTALVSYNVFMADNVTKLLLWFLNYDNVDVLRSHFWGTRPFLIAVPLVTIAIPLASQRHIGSLSKLGLFTVGCTLVSLTFFGMRLDEYRVEPTLNSYNFFAKDIISGMAIIVSGFMTHESTFVFHNSLHNPTRGRWAISTTIGVAISGMVMLVMGVLGYVTFEEQVQGNLLENYCNRDVLINIARIGIIATLFIAFPVGLYAGREVILESFFNTTKFQYSSHVIVGIVITTLSYGISLITDCLGIVLEISGTTSAAPLAFVMPPIIYLRLQHKHTGVFNVLRNLHIYIVLIFGIFVVISGFVNITKEIADGEVTCLDGHQPSYCIHGGINGSRMFAS